MKPRKALSQMGQGDSPPLTIAGQPADKCPYCGAGMFAYKTQTLQTRVNRYVACRNCGKRFVSSQPQTPPPPATIVREVADNDISNLEHPALTLVRESA